MRKTKPIINFTDISLKLGSPKTSKNSISQDLNSTGSEINRKSFKYNKLNDNKVSRFNETKSENTMFLKTESEPQIAGKRISQELNTDIENSDDIKTFETNNPSKDTNLENMFLGLLIDNNYNIRFNELKTIGVGGFGTVYKVMDKFDKQEYAIKIISLKGIK